MFTLHLSLPEPLNKADGGLLQVAKYTIHITRLLYTGLFNVKYVLIDIYFVLANRSHCSQANLNITRPLSETYQSVQKACERGNMKLSIVSLILCHVSIFLPMHIFSALEFGRSVLVLLYFSSRYPFPFPSPFITLPPHISPS